MASILVRQIRHMKDGKVLEERPGVWEIREVLAVASRKLRPGVEEMQRSDVVMSDRLPDVWVKEKMRGNRREERMKKNADCGVCGQKREKSAPEKNAGKCCLCYWRGVLFWQDSFSCFIKIHIPEK